MDWMVETSNHAAQAFYANLGACMLPEWRRWRFELNKSSAQSLQECSAEHAQEYANPLA
jgi:hypothetical protein